MHIRNPEPISRPEINFIVLGLAFLFEGTSWTIAVREFLKTKGERNWWRALRDSKDPSTLVVMSEDSAALIGIFIAAIFIAASLVLDMPVLDGTGSILIGIILGIVALLLARETKGLLIGERADPSIADSIREIVKDQADYCVIGDVRTSHLGPEEILAVVTLDFQPNLRASEVAQQMQNIDSAIKERHSMVKGVFLKPYVSKDDSQNNKSANAPG